jgi:hypothetical protein
VRADRAGLALKCAVTETASGREVRQAALTATDGWKNVEVPPLPAGSYRLAVTGPPEVEPAGDVFAVLER